MYANLKHYGGSNHLLVPTGLLQEGSGITLGLRPGDAKSCEHRVCYFGCLKCSLKGDIDIDTDIKVDVDADSCFGCLKTVQVLFNGIEAVMGTGFENSEIASPGTGCMVFAASAEGFQNR